MRRIDPRPASGNRALRALRQLWSSPAARFLIRYPICTALVFLVPALWPSVERLSISATLASLSVARLFMSSVQVSETTFMIGNTPIQIVSDCTPLSPTLLLAGGILAYPADGRSKVVGFVAGAAVLWVYNLLRIYLLMAVLCYAPAQFDLVHVYLWQSLTMLAVVGCFLFWVRGLRPDATRA